MAAVRESAPAPWTEIPPLPLMTASISVNALALTVIVAVPVGVSPKVVPSAPPVPPGSMKLHRAERNPRAHCQRGAVEGKP